MLIGVTPVSETVTLSALAEQAVATGWPLLAILAVIGMVLVILSYGLFVQHKAIKLLTKECRRVNTVSVGIGQHILAIEKHNDELVTKARDLLISGASVDDVTQDIGLSRAEVSLISNLTKSSSANNVHPINNSNQR